MYIKYIILTLVTLLFACSPDSETTETPASSSDRAINLATDKVVLQLGHSSDVNAVAFSPDGKTALSGSRDYTVKWWDLSSGRLIKTLEAHSAPVNAVAFSPDGKTALSGSGWDSSKDNDNSVKWWDLSSGRVIKSLEAHSGSVNVVAFSPNGKTALSGSRDYTVKWWDLSSGRLIKSLEAHSASVNAVAFSPDGKTALSGSGWEYSKDNTVKWWDLSSGQLIKSLEAHSDSVNAVAFSPDGKTALSDSSDGTVKLFDLSSGRVIKSLEASAIAFSPDAKTALSGSGFDGTVKVFELSSRLIKSFEAHSDSEVNAVAFSPDGKTALSGSGFFRIGDDDNTVKWWDLSSGRVIKSFEAHSHSVISVAFSPDGKTAFSNSSKMWDFSFGINNNLKILTGWISSVAFSPDGKTALSALSDGTVKWWELSSGRVIKSFRAHSGGVNFVAFSPDGKTALSGEGNTVKWWELSSGHVIKSFEADIYFSDDDSVAFSPDGKTALSGGDSMKWWDLSSGEVINSFEAWRVSSVAFSPDGKTALSGSSYGGSVEWWDLSSGDLIKSLEAHSFVLSVAFSPDGKTALSGGNTMKWWDLSSGRVIKKVHSGGVNSVAFSPNGKTALSGSYDHTIRLWNLETGEEIIRLVEFEDGESVAIMPQQGYYAASPKGEKYINVSFGNRAEGIEGYEKYKKFYHRPDILKLAWQLGDAERAIALANQNPLIPPQKRFALVIGNSKYQYYSTLDNAENDANKLAQVLRTLGFEVTLAKNLNLRQMKKVFRQFRQKLRQHKQAVGLFYFAGHGVRYEKHNYLIPIGANSDLMQEWQAIDVNQIEEWKKELNTTAMKTAYVSDMMKAAGNQINLIILDACRNLPFTQVRGLRTGQMALPSGLNQEKANSGFLIAYAASPGEAAADGTGDNSPYIQHLVKWMQKPNMRLVDILRKVRKGVEKETNGKQNPDYDDKLDDPFYFVRQ